MPVPKKICVVERSLSIRTETVIDLIGCTITDQRALGAEDYETLLWIKEVKDAHAQAIPRMVEDLNPRELLGSAAAFQAGTLPLRQPSIQGIPSLWACVLHRNSPSIR